MQVASPKSWGIAIWRQAFSLRNYQQKNMVIMPSDVLSGSSPLFSFYAALRSQEPMVLQEEGGVTLSGSSLLLFFFWGEVAVHTPHSM